MSSLIYSNPFVPFLKPGHLVAVHPLTEFGVYKVPESASIELLPIKLINLATPYTDPITSPMKKEITTLDVDNDTLAAYRIGVYDDISIKIYQPAAVARFTDRQAPISITKSTTLAALQRGLYELLPEIYVFADKTRPTIEVTSYESNPYWARIFAVGFKYPVDKVGSSLEQFKDKPILHIRANVTPMK